MARRAPLALVLVLAACGGGGGRGAAAPPEATLAGTPEVEAAFAPLRAQWAQRDFDRTKLKTPLERFVVANPSDPTARLASVYLSIIYMDLGDLPRASKLLGSLGKRCLLYGLLGFVPTHLLLYLWLRRQPDDIAPP